MIDTAIKYRKITLVILLILAITGLYNYYIMPKQENPDMDVPYAMIITVYPGASPEDVKELVTDKIEKEVSELPNIKATMTESRNSVSVIIVELLNGSKTDKAWQQLYRSMDEVQGELPKECFPIQVSTDLYKTAGMIISLSSEDFSYDELEDFGDEYIRNLSKVEGLSSFEVVGKQQREIVIEVDMDQLNMYPLSMEDVANIIASQNVKIPAGQLDSANGKVSINTAGTYTSLEDIENVILLISESGSSLRVRDVANVYYNYSEDNFKVRYNGENGILLTAYFKEDENILLIGDEVKGIVESTSTELPSDLHVNYVIYQPDDVSSSINDFMINLIEGIAIVIIIVLIGLGLRNAIIVSVAIPLSIMSTFIMMQVLGIKIHQISIVALIIALGMLVDNAIVVSDAIQVNMDKGMDRLKACVQGVKSVAIPVLTSTLTTVGAFTALLLLKGSAGQFIASIPQILIIALVASYLIALFVTPTLAYIFFRPTREKRVRIHVVKRFFDSLLHKGMKYPRMSVAVTVFMVFLAGLLLLGINISLLPIADNNMVYIDIYSDKVGDINRTEEIVDQIEEVLTQQNEVVSYTSSIGGPLPKFYYSMAVYATSPDFAQIMFKFDLKGSDITSQQAYAEYIQNQINENVVGGDIEAKLLKQAEPVPDVKFIITDHDMEQLITVSRNIEDIVRGIEGTKNVRTDYSPKEYQFYVDVNPAVAMYYGISKYDVQKEISLAVAGKEVSTFVNEGKELPIIVKGDFSNIDQLTNFAIKSSFVEKKAMVKQVADVNFAKQTTNIKSYNKDLAITVMADVELGYNAVDIATEIEKDIKKLGIDKRITVFDDGEKSTLIEQFSDVGLLAIIAVLLVFGVLLIQFKSYLQPLLILITLPLACVGSLLGLFITRQDLSFTALIGMVSLIGIVVNNAIVLLDFINEERSKGKSVKEACVDAVDKRFRPIMLSSLTTVMGLVPLVFSGSVLFVPMAVALIFGLLVATLLTLVFFPVVYYMVYGKKDSVYQVEVGGDSH